MSAAAESPAEAAPDWTRLERAVEAAVAAVATWRARALEAEGETGRLRKALEASLADENAQELGGTQRLRAENAVLHSRMEEARRRMTALAERLRVLEGRG